MNVIVEHINSAGFSFIEFAVPMLVQSGVLIAILLLADLLLRKKVKAVFRYWIWMLVILKLVLPTSLSSPLSLGYLFGEKLSYQNLSETAPSPQPTVDTSYGINSISMQPKPYIPPVMPGLSGDRPAAAEQAGPPTAPVTPLSWQGIVFLVWLAVVIAMGLLLLQRALFVRGLVAQAKEAPRLMNDALEYCRASMKIKCKVVLKISPNATTPSVCGLIRPVILVPWNLASTLGASRLRTVLMHELAHIKRADLWLNLAQTILQIVYFYNPLLWLANCMIRRIREQAVDEAVLVAMGTGAQQYPQTLVDVAKMAFKRPALSLRLIGVVESESALAGRIKHILSRPIPKSTRLGIVGVLAVIITGAVLLPMAKAQKRTEAEEKIAAAKLICEAELVKDKLAFGEEPQFLVRLTNTTGKPIDIMGYSDEPKGHFVYRYPFPCAQVEITGYGMRSWDSAAAVPTAIRIEPGKSWSFEFPPPYVQRWASEPTRVVPYLTTYLPGRHTAKVRYFIRENEKQRFGPTLVFDEKMGALAGKKPDHLWEGVVQSNTLTFEVLDDDSEQLKIRRAVDAGEGIKQYLQMELTCSKDKVNTGDAVQLSLSAKNTGRETLYLGNNYGLHWTGPKGQRSSFSGLGSATAREVKPAATLVLGGWNFGPGQAPVPGIYKVWVEYTLEKSIPDILKKSNIVTIEVFEDASVSGYDHFVGKYAIDKYPDEPVFEITKKGDVFIFSDLGGPKFEMDIVLRGLDGRSFEMEKGRDSLKFGNDPRERYSVRYNAAEGRYILDSLGMRGEVQDAVISPLTNLIKISSEKPRDYDLSVEGERYKTGESARVEDRPELVSASIAFHTLNIDGSKVITPAALTMELKDKAEAKKLASYFPRMEEKRISGSRPWWNPAATIIFYRSDDTAIVVNVSADMRNWISDVSQGDWPVQGDLREFLSELKNKAEAAGTPGSKTDVPVEGEQGDESTESKTTEPKAQEPVKQRGGISGIVVNSVTGEPVAGAYVGVGDFGDAGGSNYSRHREEGFHDKTKTDEKGRFELDGLAFTDDHPYLKYHPLVVTHPDFVRHDEKIELLSTGPAPNVKVSLRPAAKIDVTIVDADGNPLEGQWLLRLEALDGRRFIPPGSDPHLSSFASSIWEHTPDLRANMGVSNGFTFTELDTGEYSIEAIRFHLVDKPTPQNVWKPAITYHCSITNLKIEAGRTKEVKLAPQSHQTKLTITPPKFPDVLMDELKVSSRMPLICIISRSPGAMLWDDGKIYHLEDQRLGRIDKKRFFRCLFTQGKPLIINNLPPGSYSFFAVAIYGQVAGCLIGARAELVKGDDITVDIPWRQPEGPSIVGPSPNFDYPVKLEHGNYTVSKLCEILTSVTESNPRIIADNSIENEKIRFGNGEMSVWDVLENLYLDKGWKVEEGPDKTLIIVSANKSDV